MEHTVSPEKLLLTYLQVYDSYHRQKETMTWVVTVLLIGGMAFLIATKEPFWKIWKSSFNVVFIAFVVLLLLSGYLAWKFLREQFENRDRAARLYTASANLAAIWISTKPEERDLLPVQLCEFQCMMVPLALAEEFRKIKKPLDSKFKIITWVALASWGAAALLRVLFLP